MWLTTSPICSAGTDPFKLYPDIWLSEVQPWLMLPIMMKPATHMGAGCPPAYPGLVIDLAVFAGILPVGMVPLPAPGRLNAGEHCMHACDALAPGLSTLLELCACSSSDVLLL